METLTEAHRVSIVGTATTAYICDKCGSRARYAGLDGQWCGGHWSARKAYYRPIIAQTRAALALRYRVDVETLSMALENDWGFIRLKRTERPYSGMIFSTDMAELEDLVFGPEAPDMRVHLQLFQLTSALWALALRWGNPLQGFPRQYQIAPEDIPWGLVDWMEQDARAFQWVQLAGMRYRAEIDRRGRGRQASQRFTWLINNTTVPTLPVLPGPLLPPKGNLKKTA